MTSTEEKTRYQAYDETIKNLEQKDCKGLASLAIPNIDEADDVLLSMYELSMADMKKPDYLAKIKLHGEYFILHMEFESAYKSNNEMQRRMLRYYSNLYWNEDIPIKQVLVLMKEPKISNITNGVKSVVMGENVIEHFYSVVKLYKMDKYEVLEKQITSLYPLRVFMEHKGESSEEHIRECLDVAEQVNDPDYYFLTVECSRKLFGAEILEKIVKEAIYMASALYKTPYEAGKTEGKIEGKIEGKAEILVKQLTKKFGILPTDIRNKISKADVYYLDLIAESVFDLQSLDDALKYLPL
jgi:hypothetical protein